MCIHVVVIFFINKVQAPALGDTLAMYCRAFFVWDVFVPCNMLFGYVLKINMLYCSLWLSARPLC